jgi:TonB-linked SusC/RagA family outer membrane protein
MKKNLIKRFLVYFEKPRKALIMANLFLFLAMLNLQIQAGVFETTVVNLNMQNATLYEMLESIEQQTEVGFLYNETEVNTTEKITVEVNNMPLSELLNDVLPDLGVDYEIDESVIILMPRQAEDTVVESILQETIAPITIEIKGKITDNEGAPLPGTTVMEKGTLNGVTTDFEGKFVLKVANSESVLRISYIGFESQELIVGQQTNFTIVMQASTSNLDEVIVVAYGTSTKKSFTGSVSVIKPRELTKQPTTSITKALQATSPGVQVLSETGAAGSEATIRIRGLGSIASNSDPLWVIDGVAETVVLMHDDEDKIDRATATRPNLDDIESISILKDAAAASLYGSRAGNGVIIITTKKGRTGKTRFKFKTEYGISNRTRSKFELLDASEFLKVSWNGIKNYADDKGQAWLTKGGYTSSADYAHKNLVNFAGKNPYNINQPFDDNGNIVSGAKLMYDTDWFNLVHQTGTTKKYNLSVSGGNDKTTFYISGGYYDQKGIVAPDFYTRYSAQINVKSNVTDKIKIGINSNFKHSMTRGVYDMTNGTSTGYAAYTYPNNVPLYKLDENFKPIIGDDGQPEYNYENKVSQDFNPIALTKLNTRRSKSTLFTLSPYLQYKIIPGLTFKTIWGGKMYFYDDLHFENPYHGDGKSVNGRSTKEWRESRLYTSSNTLTYDKIIKEKHNINVLLGYEFEKYEWHNIEAQTKNFAIPVSDELSIGGSPEYARSKTSENSMISYFSKVDYNYDNKYYVGISFRRDGSSRFSSVDNRNYGNFYSISGSWRLSKEDFIKNLGFFNSLKLRASYGTSGVNNIGEYKYLPLYTVESSYMELIGLRNSQLTNSNLLWEKSKILNIGINFSIFNNKLDVSIEYYKKESDDLLLDKPLPLSTGWENKIENIGALQNDGFEFNLISLNVHTKDFEWFTNFNLSFYKNKITALSQDEIIDENKRWVVGNSLKVWYMREWAGVNPENGAGQWYKDILDSDNKPTGKREKTENYDAATRYELGESLPDFYGGMTNTLVYKDFTFSMTLYFSVGSQIYDDLEQETMNDGENFGYQLNKKVLNAWTPENPNTEVPRYVYNNRSKSNYMSSRFLHDGSFLRLSNISLNYSIPKRIISNIGLESANVYVTGDNLWVWTSYEGNDPEQGIDGLNGTNIVPNIRTITFGIKIGF